MCLAHIGHGMLYDDYSWKWMEEKEVYFKKLACEEPENFFNPSRKPFLAAPNFVHTSDRSVSLMSYVMGLEEEQEQEEKGRQNS